jgi:spermidine synthase
MPGAKLNADIWITEYITPYDVYHHGIIKVFASQKTAYQEMSVVESGRYGKALVLDGKWQSCTGDEFLYHEPLVHPACVNHKAPKTILILGGGEGATVREALKWNSVEKVVMVDIDGEVVEACKQHLPEMHQGAFDDPRTELVIGDALDYLDNSSNEWDIIISDLSDPIEEGPSFKLFTKEYFEKCRRALRPNGFFVIQAGNVSPVELTMHARLNNTVKSVFNHAVSFCSHTPTYGAPWGFVLGGDLPIEQFPDPDKIDALLKEKTTGSFRMFDGRTLLGLMNPPKHLRDAVAAETRVYSLADPPKFFGSGASGA